MIIRKREKTAVCKSSALAYAITFLLLVSLVCSAVLFISSANKRLQVNFEMAEHLVFDNLFALNFGAQSQKNERRQLIHVNGDTTDLIVKNWGAFKVVVATTFHHSRSISKTALIGESSLFTYATIYLPDNKQSLKICGTTSIDGNVYLSSRGLEPGYIGNSSYKRDKLINGEIRNSTTSLPKLFSSFENVTIEDYLNDASRIDYTIKDSVFSFKNKTSLMSQVEPIIISNSLKGNLIIHSFESIVVSSNAQLENVILIAPEVIFEEGFQGSLQVIAHEKVVLNKNVKLSYPSTIILNELKRNDLHIKRGVFLEEGSSLIGGILLTSQTPDFRAQLVLEMKNATVGGLIYNVGETQVSGKVHGYIYTNNFTLNAGGGEYKNYLLDAEISSKELPEAFLLPSWISQKEKKRGELITWF